MSVKPIPDGFHAVTPYLVVRDVAQQLEFLTKAFDAKITEKVETPMGIMHAEVKIRDSVIMMGQAGGEHKPMPAMLYLYVEDADKAYEKALRAGGTKIQEPTDQFYGDRSGAVKDSNDNQWWVATHVKDVSHEEMNKLAAEMGKQKSHSK